MGLLSDRQIKELCRRPPNVQDDDWAPMISPFEPKSVRYRMEPFAGSEVKEKVISYGLSSYGYDVRCGNTLKLFTNRCFEIIDPKEMDSIDRNVFVEYHKADHEYFILPAMSFALTHTKEFLTIPRDILVECLGKSTYARAGTFINITPIEPGFKGQVVIEIFNSTPLPVKIYAGEGIAQFLFHRGEEPCEVSYADRNGKYQGQQGIVLGR